MSHSTPGSQKSLMDMMSQLMTRMDKLEAKNFKQVDRAGDRAD